MPAATDFVIVPRNPARRKAGELLTDPRRYPVPPTTTVVAEAKRFRGRNGAHKFLTRNKRLAKHFTYQKIGS